MLSPSLIHKLNSIPNHSSLSLVNFETLSASAFLSSYDELLQEGCFKTLVLALAKAFVFVRVCHLSEPFLIVIFVLFANVHHPKEKKKNNLNKNVSAIRCAIA